VAGIVIPLFPWLWAVIYGFLPRRGGYDDSDVEMARPGQDHPAVAAATKQREIEMEDRHWAAGALLLAGVVGALVAYDRGLIGGI
jgi:hypothetical protein